MSVQPALRERIRAYYTRYYRDTLGLRDWTRLVALREDEEKAEEAQLDQLQRALAVTDLPAPVLNVGCGTGGFNVVAAARGARLVGVDADAEAMAICALKRRAHGGGVFVRAAAEALPFRDATFALVYCFSAIEHVDSVAATVAEMVRVTRPGGHIYVHTPNAWSWYEGHYKVHWVPFLPRAAGRLYLRLQGRPTDYLATLRRLTPRGLAREFQRHGVRDLRFFDHETPRESIGRLWPLLKHYYRLAGVAPFVELVARKP
ncbi:MAG TPA: class I SAM-dependent methyltransferase [Methylomirabilota bacterium]|nr:class I SAM-dependent methyltransferase [Methylomirabilota bacterium]